MSSALKKIIAPAKGRKIARWKVRIIGKFKSIKEFIDCTNVADNKLAPLNYGVFSNWLHGWKIPSAAAIENVEAWMKKLGI